MSHASSDGEKRCQACWSVAKKQRAGYRTLPSPPANPLHIWPWWFSNPVCLLTAPPLSSLHPSYCPSWGLSFSLPFLKVPCDFCWGSTSSRVFLLTTSYSGTTMLLQTPNSRDLPGNEHVNETESIGLSPSILHPGRGGDSLWLRKGCEGSCHRSWRWKKDWGSMMKARKSLVLGECWENTRALIHKRNPEWLCLTCWKQILLEASTKMCGNSWKYEYEEHTLLNCIQNCTPHSQTVESKHTHWDISGSRGFLCLARYRNNGIGINFKVCPNARSWAITLFWLNQNPRKGFQESAFFF